MTCETNAGAPDPSPVAPATSTITTVEHRTKLEACAWMLAGAVAAYGGAAFAAFLTLKAFENATDIGMTGLIIFVTIPAGWLIGLFAVQLCGWSQEQQRPSSEDAFTRSELAAAGAILPIVLPIATIFILKWLGFEGFAG